MLFGVFPDYTHFLIWFCHATAFIYLENIVCAVNQIESSVMFWFSFKSSSKIFVTDRSKAVLFCGSFIGVFCLVFVMHLSASVYLCLVVTCW